MLRNLVFDHVDDKNVDLLGIYDQVTAKPCPTPTLFDPGPPFHPSKYKKSSLLQHDSVG